MDISTFFNWFWWILAGVLILAEFLLPGLVVVFVGLGALTVAVLKYYGVVNQIHFQFLTWFISSIIYSLTLRFLVIKFYPSDTKKQTIDEDQEVIGAIVEVSKEVNINNDGRIKHSDSTWPARSENDEIISTGEKVRIVGRENLTWIVEKIKKEE